MFLPDLPEIEAKGKMEERTRWWGQSESQIEEKWQTCWCCQDHQRACKMAQTSAEKLEHTGPAEKERVALVPQRAVGKNARAVFAKRKRNKAVCPKHQIVKWDRVKVSKSRSLAREGDQSRSMERKG